MQTTKPTYPVKDKNSEEIPIKRWRDVDANEILDSFEKVDQNFNNIAEPDIDQFIELNGRYTLASKYRRPTNSIIDFRTSGQRLNPAAPLYEFTIPADYLVWQNVGNFWDVFVSATTVPQIITDASPDTPLATYVSEAAMLADQASQIEGKEYTYDDVTYWTYNGLATGSMDDYVKWTYFMTVAGTFLTGYANLNRCTFLLDQVYNALDDIYELKVVCNITQAEGANQDPNPPVLFDEAVLIDLPMNEPDALVIGETYPLINNSNYALDWEAANPSLNSAEIRQVVALTSKLSPNGYNLGQGVDNSNRAYLFIDKSSIANNASLFANNQISIMFEARFLVTPSYALQVINNVNLAGLSGGIAIDTTTTGLPQFYVFENGDATQHTAGYATANRVRCNSGMGTTFRKYVVTFDGTTVNWYADSSTAAATSTNLTGRNLANIGDEDFYTGRRPDSVVINSEGFEIKTLKVLNKIVSTQEIDEFML